MSLRLHYRGQTTIPVEIEGLVPSTIRDKSVAEIQRLEIFCGKEKLPLAELFDIAGDATDARWELEGDLSGVHWIGCGMDAGEIHVAGNAGRHLGSEMTGGRILVEGNAGDWLGGQMRGGRIEVRGQAADAVGAAYAGSPRGMTGGTILVHGPAGNDIGHSMRRGLIAVGGAADGAGVDLIAGTILVFGRYGIRHGANMRRGTIGLFGPERLPLLPTFRRACRYRPVWLTALLRSLCQQAYPVPGDLMAAEYELYHGDLVTLGRGEILLPA